MGEVHGIDSRVYLDELNLSGYATQHTLTFNVDLAECQTISDTWKERLPGGRSANLAWTAYFDTTDGGYDEQQWTDITTNVATTRYGMVMYGTTAGSACYEVPGKYTGRDMPAPYDGVVGLSAGIEGHGAASRGESILVGATITTTGVQTGQNCGATASGTTCVVTYRVHSITGSIVMALEESSDDGSADAYAAIAALASGTLSAAGVTRKTTTDATEAWKRINTTTAPTTASVTVTVTTY